jgi:dihydrofolate reductase / thymidylate synthase
MLNIIVAKDNNNNIGYQNKLIYSIPEDLKYFRDITTFTNDRNKINAIIMGRKTWDSIPDKVKPLKNRLNIILSKTENKKISSPPNNQIQWFTTLQRCIIETRKNKNIENMFIIGGESLYKQSFKLLPLIDYLYITEVDHNLRLANPIKFPEYNTSNFYLQSVYQQKYTDIKYLDTQKIPELSCKYCVYANKLVNKKVGGLSYYNFYTQHRMLNTQEFQYLKLLNDLIVSGDKRQSRNSITYSNFGVRMEFDLKNGMIPALTTKKLAWKTVIKELLWFISGDTNNKTLTQQKVRIWNGNSSREYLDSIGLTEREEGDLGPIYGFQWRHSGAEYKDCHTQYHNQGVDQLMDCIRQIKENPYSRRMLVCAWNPKDLKLMALPPCHILFQWYVSSDGYLSLQLYQRSGDMFLGVPFNIFSYSVLIYMVAQVTGLKPGKFVHIIGDCHAYECHLDAIKTQLTRIPNQFPKLSINKEVTEIDKFTIDDFKLIDYCYHRPIKATMIP